MKTQRIHTCMNKNAIDEIILKNKRSESFDPTSINMNFEGSLSLKSSHSNTVSIKNHEHNNSNKNGMW